MKIFLVVLALVLSSCCKDPKVSTPIATPNTTTNLNAPIPNELEETNSGVGPYEVFLGLHHIEYFADRMVLKSKRAGYDFATKKTYQKNGQTVYQVHLGPFDSKESALQAEAEIKALTPDLTISRVRSVKP